jgi:hypothetical protein
MTAGQRAMSIAVLYPDSEQGKRNHPVAASSATPVASTAVVRI